MFTHVQCIPSAQSGEAAGEENLSVVEQGWVTGRFLVDGYELELMSATLFRSLANDMNKGAKTVIRVQKN